MNQYGVDIDRINKKNLLIGITLNVVSTFAFFVIVFFMLQKGEVQKNAMDDITLFMSILIAVSVSEIAVAVFIRRKILFNPMITSKENFKTDFEKWTTKVAVMMSAFSEAIAVYGLILFFLSGDVLIFTLFAVASLAFFAYIRPKDSVIRVSLAKQEQFVMQGRYYDESDFFNRMMNR